MNKTSAIVLSLLVSTAACPEESEVDVSAAQVDVAKLRDGVTVTLSGKTGKVTVPLSRSLPEAPKNEVESELSAAVNLVVSSTSGESVTLKSDGKLVTGTPAAPGEFAWSINGDRDEVTLTFYNEAKAGQSLKAGSSYTASLTVGTNDLVERLGATTFPVTVK